MSAILLAPRRVHPSIIFVAQTQAKLRALMPSPLDGDQILGDEGQILTAPPETEEPIQTTTTPAPDGANDRVLAEQIAAIDDAHFLALNIEADEVERDHQRAEIARMKAEQFDAYHCGQSRDYSDAIEAAQTKIAIIDERLFSHDLACELCA